jgi:hypothetical protein
MDATQSDHHARHDGGAVRVPWHSLYSRIIRLTPMGAKRAATCRTRQVCGPWDPSGPGCWTTFLTCPNRMDAQDVSAAQLMG